MRRVRRDAAAQITAAVTDPDGETLATDATAAEVAVTRSNGDPVTGSPFTVTEPLDTGELSIDLPAAAFDALDTLHVEWTIARPSGDQVVTAQVQVVGGFLYEARQLRARYPKELGDASKFTPATVRENRDQIHDLFDDACYVSFVPAARRVRYEGIWSQLLPLEDLEIIAVREILIDGVALTVEELAEVTVLADTGHLIRSAGWCNGTRKTVEVLYEHGLPSVPGDIEYAAMLLAKNTIQPSSTPSRATSISTDNGSFRLSTAGRDGRTGIPEVDAALERYGAGSSLVAL